MAEIPVTGGVLEWARDFRKLSLDDAAARIGISADDLFAIEQGTRKPNLGLFEKIASAYKLPLATLFRRTPPDAPPMPLDFRTFEGAPAQISFDFLVALSDVRTLQAALRALRVEDEQFNSAQLRQYRFQADPFQQGEAEREELRITIGRQLDWPSGQGFRHWRAIVEKLGISVYLQKFPLEDCRGYSLWDDDATPVIVINKNDKSENAWVYTLIHEYAHLLIRRPGISDLSFGNPVEAFCNRFAAAFLMPVAALRIVLPEWPDNRIDWDLDEIRETARRLKVSPQALAIRLEELGKAEIGFNRAFAFVPGPGKKKTKKTKVSYVKTRLSEIGGHYTTSVIGALDRDVIDSVHASQALGISPPHFKAVRVYVDRQRELASA